MRATFLGVILLLLLAGGCESGHDSPTDGDADSGEPDRETGMEEEESEPEEDSETRDAEREEEPSDLPFVTDAQGRVLILHGANVDSHAKSSPYLPNITREQVARFSSEWGFNFVRYLVLWAGVEPRAGEYDAEYLDRIEERLDWFYEAHIWVMLDVHQDVYSEFTCGDGAPEWAVRTDGLAVECPSQWFLGYFQPGVQRAFDNFWDAEGPHGDLQQRYAEMWAALVARFKDHPAVIAYDLINEPHPGSDFDAAEALGLESRESPSPEFDRTKLRPFYQRMIQRIREVDTERWIAFEPRYGAPGNGSPSFLDGLVDPRPGPPRLLYAPHLYSVKQESSQRYDPASDFTIAKWEEERREERATLGAALVAGEWGLSPDWTNSRLFIRELLTMADRLMSGWAYWSWDPGGWSWVNPDLSERETTDDLVRVYPPRIAGIPERFSYDPDTRVFTLAFSDRPGIDGPTEIYVPARRFYPEGWDLTVSDEPGSWSMEWDESREVLSVTTPKTGGSHTLEIRARAPLAPN